jgi:hypothetical protein
VLIERIVDLSGVRAQLRPFYSQHVQACFAAEVDVAAAIEAGMMTTRTAVDDAFAAL